MVKNRIFAVLLLVAPNASYPAEGRMKGLHPCAVATMKAAREFRSGEAKTFSLPYLEDDEFHNNQPERIDLEAMARLILDFKLQDSQIAAIDKRIEDVQQTMKEDYFDEVDRLGYERAITSYKELKKMLEGDFAREQTEKNWAEMMKKVATREITLSDKSKIQIPLFREEQDLSTVAELFGGAYRGHPLAKEIARPIMKQWRKTIEDHAKLVEKYKDIGQMDKPLPSGPQFEKYVLGPSEIQFYHEILQFMDQVPPSNSP